MSVQIIAAIIGAAALIIAAFISITPSLFPDEKTLDEDQPKISISSPENGAKVTNSVEVKGSILGELPKDNNMWLVLNPKVCPNQWWPQNNGRIIPTEGQWYGMTAIGGGKKDIGKTFEIAVVLVNNKDDQIFVECVKDGRETGNYPGIELPANAVIKDQITVTLSEVQ
jgi:hypothetical protein